MSGVRAHHASASASASSGPAIAQELSRAFAGMSPIVIVFFVGSNLDFPEVVASIAQAFPSSSTVGCTTCGEIGPDGCSNGRVVALAIDAPARAEAVLIEQVSALKFERAAAIVRDLDARFGDAEPSTRVLVTLTDGLSGAEELLLAAAKAAAPEVMVVGGSAADDFAFQQTAAAVDGVSAVGAAALLMLEPQRPFVPFHLHHYSRGGGPMVVTGAEPARRLVTRIDGFPAANKVIETFAIDEALLREQPAVALARAVFGSPVGSSTFLRSVMAVQGDALLMGGAIDEGALLYPMVAGDLVDATREGLARALARVANPDGLLLFNCGGRLWEARATKRVDALAEAMTLLSAVGFSTYGEQFGHMQVNHTLTGLVFGRGDG